MFSLAWFAVAVLGGTTLDVTAKGANEVVIAATLAHHGDKGRPQGVNCGAHPDV